MLRRVVERVVQSHDFPSWPVSDQVASGAFPLRSRRRSRCHQEKHTLDNSVHSLPGEAPCERAEVIVPSRRFSKPRTLLSLDVRSNISGHEKAIVNLLGPSELPVLNLKKMPKPAIKASVVSGPNADGVVTIVGHTYAKAKVKLDIGATGKIEKSAKADKHGMFRFTFPVGFGTTSVRLSASAAGHQATSTILAVKRIDLVPPKHT